MAQSLPAPVEAALARAQIPREAVALYVAPVEAPKPARLAWQTAVPMNPASVMKLVTTYSALEQLGPTYVWRTPVYVDGVLDKGTLRGTVYIKGVGDPKLVSERLWLMLGRLQGMGIQTIAGDIVIDRSAFDVQGHDPAAFDGEPFRPYNAGPDALLVNYKTQVLGFMPDPAAGVARIHYELPLGTVQAPQTVPLAPQGTACGDWRAQLQADWRDPNRIQLAGRYPASCGDKNWPVALPDPQAFALKAIDGMWRNMGGQLTGSVREGAVPAHLKPVWENQSPALGEVVRDINKFSNNVMTQQVLLTLGKERLGVGSFDTGRTALAQWWQSRWPAQDMPVVENGAGLSRNARISAQALGRMLQAAWASSVMPEFVASLPISGMDGTLRRSKASANAHLKTGSLRDANTLAGYVHGNSGQRYVLVAMVNHPNAGHARPVMDALVDWVAQD
ncbi:MAG: D-alanyl-D-alanine carboxypeptidase/D-alanyl-D-alanine-endopeptidase [Comamonadaceae bacterium]|nr:D-alanyl-D-alanine carboxypeptidase/D-alanyl-D-alanine-endopeptidase [Comamonadaceae bacterium]